MKQQGKFMRHMYYVWCALEASGADEALPKFPAVIYVCFPSDASLACPLR